MEKPEALAHLISRRKQDRKPKYCSLSEFDGGYYDVDWVSPWTVSACSLDADLMIVAQDWASTDSLMKRSTREQKEARRRCGQDPDLPTNKRLKELLKEHFGLEFSDTYATNLFVFIKPGGISATIPMEDLKYCAEKFTLPEIEIVRPRMVLCLGARTFNAIQRALDHRPSKLNEASLPTAHTKLQNGVEIYGVPHTGSWGTKNAGGKVNVDAIWARLASRFAELLAKPRPLSATAALQSPYEPAHPPDL
jgi:restriction system protein